MDSFFHSSQKFRQAVPTIWNVKSLSNYFIGRETFLNELVDTLHCKSNCAFSQAITGLGGIGKTQLVLAYANRYKEKYQIIWWFDADSNLDKAFQDLSEQLKAKFGVSISINPNATLEQIRSAVMDTLRTLAPNWLLIFDNVIDEASIQPYLPQKQIPGLGHVIITSCYQDWQQLESIKMDVLPLEDAVEVLRVIIKRTFNQDENKFAKKLAEKLGSLPLALVQASIYIKNAKLSIKDYIQRFDKQLEILWQNENAPVDHLKTIHATLAISMQQVNSTHAEELLRYCAYLGGSNIPKTLLRCFIDDEITLDGAITSLAAYSLLEHDEQVVSIHNLVQSVTRLNIDKENQSTNQWFTKVLTILLGQINFDILNESSRWQQLSSIIPHITSALEYINDSNKLHYQNQLYVLLYRIAEYQVYYEGRYKEAIDNLNKALEIGNSFINNEEIDIIKILKLKGNALYKSADYINAEQTLIKAIEVYAKEKNIEDTESVELFSKAIEGAEELYYDLARAYWVQPNKAEKAKEILLKLIELTDKNIAEIEYIRGDEADLRKNKLLLEKARCYHQLGNVFSIGLKQYDEAIQAFEKALTIFRDFKKEKHIADTLHGIGGVYLKKDNVSEAESYLVNALSIKLELYTNNESHPELFPTYGYLSEVYLLLNNIKQAGYYCQKALKIAEFIYGKSHVHTKRILQLEENIQKASNQTNFEQIAQGLSKENKVNQLIFKGENMLKQDNKVQSTTVNAQVILNSNHEYTEDELSDYNPKKSSIAKAPVTESQMTVDNIKDDSTVAESKQKKQNMESQLLEIEQMRVNDLFEFGCAYGATQMFCYNNMFKQAMDNYRVLSKYADKLEIELDSNLNTINQVLLSLEVIPKKIFNYTNEESNVIYFGRSLILYMIVKASGLPQSQNTEEIFTSLKLYTLKVNLEEAEIMQILSNFNKEVEMLLCLEQVKKLLMKTTIHILRKEIPTTTNLKMPSKLIIPRTVPRKSYNMIGSIDEIKKSIANNLSAESVFQSLAKAGYTWTRIKQVCLFNKQLDQEAQREGQQLVKQLIAKREQLDEVLYRQAIEALFPKNKNFTILEKPARDLKANSLGFKLKYYEFWVFNDYISKRELDVSSLPHATIAIKAPGSRDLTSDIDTTVQVTGIAQLDLSLAQWPEVNLNLNEYDGEVLVQRAIVLYFNQLNDELVGMPAGVSRDSNVYTEGFLHPRGYPKFTRYDLSFDEEFKLDFDIFYAPYKQVKQQQELAASLCSLREYFAKTNKEWENWRDELIITWQDKYEDTQIQQVFTDSMLAVFRMADNYYQYKVQSLASLMKHIQEEHVHDDTMQIQDSQVAAMNCCYSEHLLEVARKYQKVAKAHAIVDDVVLRLKKKCLQIKVQAKAVQVATETLANLDNSDADEEIYDALKEKYTLDLKNEQTKLVEFKDQAASLRAYTETQLKVVAVLINEQQEAQIKANLFANEAYVNRSAPYHVVQWLQSQDEAVRIDKKQVVMGSALQQIGFRLLHAHELRQAQHEEGEILYTVSKYGLRVADMLFGSAQAYFKDKVFTEDELKQIIKGQALTENTESLSILSRLKGASQHNLFKLSEYRLVNQDIELYQAVKKNNNVELHQKATEAESLLRAWIFKQKNPQQTQISMHDKASIQLNHIISKLKQDDSAWLEMAKHLVIITYISKLEQTQHLWGSINFVPNR